MRVRQVEFNFEVGGQPAGRVVVQLYDDAPVGSARFFELAKGGAEGIDYRLTKIDGIAAVRLSGLHVSFLYS